jgi:LEA14-like dessication related protein
MSKMNFRNIPYLFFLACALLMISCSQPQPFVFKGLKSIKIEKASLGKNVFKAEFTYENPNSFSLALNKLDADIFINDEKFTHYHLDTVFNIPANAAFDLPAIMEVDLNSILKNSIDLIFNKPMKISVKGTSTLSKGMFTKTIPIEFETTQKLNLASVLSGRN